MLIPVYKETMLTLQYSDKNIKTSRFPKYILEGTYHVLLTFIELAL